MPILFTLLATHPNAKPLRSRRCCQNMHFLKANCPNPVEFGVIFFRSCALRPSCPCRKPQEQHCAERDGVCARCRHTMGWRAPRCPTGFPCPDIKIRREGKEKKPKTQSATSLASSSQPALPRAQQGRRGPGPMVGPSLQGCLQRCFHPPRNLSAPRTLPAQGQQPAVCDSPPLPPRALCVLQTPSTSTRLPDASHASKAARQHPLKLSFAYF